MKKNRQQTRWGIGSMLPWPFIFYAFLYTPYQTYLHLAASPTSRPTPHTEERAPRCREEVFLHSLPLPPKKTEQSLYKTHYQLTVSPTQMTIWINSLPCTPSLQSIRLEQKPHSHAIDVSMDLARLKS